MNLTLRPMHESEAPLVRDSWTRSIDASVVRDERDREKVVQGRRRHVSGNHCDYLRMGSTHHMATWAFHAMHRAWVKSLWDGLDIIVAAHPRNDEPVGWCAVTPPGDHPLVVHYVYVIGRPLEKIDSARRNGTARALLRAAAKLADHRVPRFSMIVGQMDSFGDFVSNLSDIVFAAWRETHGYVEPVAPMRDGARMH